MARNDMDDLISDLEQLFQSRILDIRLSVDTGMANIYGLGLTSPLAQQVGPATYSIEIVLVHPKHSPHQWMTIFDDITNSAYVVHIKTELEYGLCRSTVGFMVSDFEKFTRDIKDYRWKKYSKEFTKQLDGVLDSE